MEEEPCVVETKGRAPKWVGRNLLEIDDELAEKPDGCFSFRDIKTQHTGPAESQVVRD